MGLLDDDYKAPFSPRRSTINRGKEGKRDNFSDLQNLGRREVTEDFSDNPHADRKPLRGDGIIDPT